MYNPIDALKLMYNLLGRHCLYKSSYYLCGVITRLPWLRDVICEIPASATTRRESGLSFPSHMWSDWSRIARLYVAALFDSIAVDAS